MSAITYFFTNLLVHNFLLALTAFLLGLLLGWLIWARRSAGPNFSAEYEAEKKKSSDLSAQLNNCKKARTDLEAKLKKADSNTGLSDELAAAKKKVSNLEAELSKAKASGASSADLSAARTKISGLETELSSLRANASNSGASDAELAAAKAKIEELETKLSSLNNDLSACRSDLDACRAEKAEPAKPAFDPSDESPEGLKAKNMAFFADDLASGKLREDEKYGLLYTQQLTEDEADDLTRIKGVAGVLNKTLNEYGVYKYRQIALWTPQICEDFSEKIAFKGRVERDNWIDQCKEFHFEKYGEKI